MTWPSGAASDAQPDYQHGYLRLPLGLWLGVVCRGLLTRRQLQLVAVVIRESWGWQTRAGQVQVWTRALTHEQFGAVTGLAREHVSRELKTLLAWGVLRQSGRRYQFEPSPERWHPRPVARRQVPQQPLFAPNRSHRGTSLVPPTSDPNKPKTEKRNVAPASADPVDSSPPSSTPTSAVVVDRFVHIVATYAGRLTPAEVAGLRRWAELAGVGPVYQALAPAFRRGPSAVRAFLKAHGEAGDTFGS